jgi:hypothetical protein
MFVEIGYLCGVFVILYFIVEIGVPAVLNDRKYFWITKSIFEKSGTNVKPLEEQISEATKAVDTAKIALEKLSNSANQESSEAKKEYQRLKEIYDDSASKLDALNKTKSYKKR